MPKTLGMQQILEHIWDSVRNPKDLVWIWMSEIIEDLDSVWRYRFGQGWRNDFGLGGLKSLYQFLGGLNLLFS